MTALGQPGQAPQVGMAERTDGMVAHRVWAAARPLWAAQHLAEMAPVAPTAAYTRES